MGTITLCDSKGGRWLSLLSNLCAIFLAAQLSACSDSELSPGEQADPEDCMSQVICQGQVAVRCASRPEEVRVDCTFTGERCFSGIGCLACSPGELLCEGSNVMQCSNDGRSKSALETCAEGCSRGSCVDLCDEAAATSS